MKRYAIYCLNSNERGKPSSWLWMPKDMSFWDVRFPRICSNTYPKDKTAQTGC